MILIPVKNLANAKERLSPVLSPPQRRALAEAMLRDVLAAAAEVNHHTRVAVVTSDSFASDLARHYQFEIIPDPANLGESDAISHATQHCIAHGADSTLVIPGDIPLVQGTTVVFSGFVIVINLVVDLAYALIDPRIRYGRAQS